MTRCSTCRALAVIVCLFFLGDFTTISAQSPCSELFISEYIEGSSNNKCIEIYNPTGSSIDLMTGMYELKFYFGGSTSAGTTIALIGTIPPGEVYVVCDNDADAGFLAVADQTSTSSFFNGDDAVALVKGGANIDVIGQIGIDPGSQWGSGLQSTQDNTLRRMMAVEQGDADGTDVFDPATEWDGFAQDNMVDLGAHASSCPGPPVISPCSELFISEYIEGSSNNKCIEIYNPTGSSIDLMAGMYELKFYFGGSTSAGTTIALIGTIPPGEVYVVCDNDADAGFLAVADQTSTSSFFNGDDAVALVKGGANIDVIGQIGTDPGSQWGSGLQSTQDNTLRRMMAVEQGDADGTDVFDPATEWDGFAQDNMVDLGAHASSCPGPPVMTPCSELFISEYIEGPSFDKCIEIYNGTGATVDLSTYTVNLYFNGSATVGNAIPLSGSLAFGEVYIVCHSSAAQVLLDESDQTTSSLSFNGNDAVELVNGMAIVDVIGQIGDDPGTEWGSGDQSTANNTLVRMSNIDMGDTDGTDAFDPATEWDGFPGGTYDDLGMHTSENCDPCGGTMLTVVATASAPEYCEGEDVVLSETGGDMNVVSWSWTGPNGFMSTDQNPTITMATAEASGTYTVEGFNAMGCSEISTVDVLVREFPVVPEVEPVIACIGGSTLIDLSQYIGPATVSECYLLDFETPGGYTTSVPEFTDLFNDYFLRTDGSDISEFVTFGNQQGMYFFAGQDLDGEGATIPLELKIDNVDVAGKPNLAFSILLAEDQSFDGNEDWDSSDEFLIDYRIDDGAWTPLLHVQNNGTGTNSIPLIDTDFDGIGDGTEITDMFTEFIVEIPGVGNEIDIRITIDLNAGDEDIAFDNIKIGSYLPEITSFNFYDGDPTMGGGSLASMVSSYDPGMAGTYWVSALNGMCEGEAVPINVVVSQGEQPLRCNDHINISLGEACAAVLTPEMFIEGEGVMYEFLEVQIMGASGVIIPDATLTGIHVGGTYTVKITDICNGNSCWSSVTLEDKLGPVFPEFCPQDQPCVVDCYTDVEEVIINVTGFLAGNITDCSGYDLLPATPIWKKASECMLPDTLVLLFTAVDDHGNITTKEYYYIYEPIAFTGITYPANVTETCTTDPLPSLTGVPTINGVPIVFNDGYDTQVCNILGSYNDIVLPSCAEDCDNSRKIVREFTLLDWCTQNIDVGIQIIHLKDLDRPILNPFDRASVSVDPWSCEVEKYQLPLIDALDNCTPYDKLETIIYGHTAIDIVQEEDGRFYAYNLPKGEHAFNFYAVDCCGNKSLVQPFILEVYDGVKPVAITKQFTVVSLSEANGDGIAKLFAESVDNGSYDNCSDVKLEIRRDGFFGRVGANDADYTRWDSLLPPFPGFPGPYAQYPCDVIGNDTYNTDYVRNEDGSLVLDLNGNPIPIVNGHSWDLPSGFNRQVDPDDGQYVKFCCYDVTAATVDVNNDKILDPGYVKVWLRVWDNADMTFKSNGEPIYGTAGDHYNETWAYVKVEVGTPPVVEVTNTTISCEWPYKEKYEEGFFLEDYWIDNYVNIDGICDVDTFLTINDVNVDDVCPGGYFELIYTITNADTKKLSSTAVQRVYIEDYNERMQCRDINWPPTYTETNCLEEGIEPELSWEAAPCDLIGWTYRTDTFMFGSDACAKIVNEYTVIDWCQWDWYYNQTGTDTSVPDDMNGTGGYFEGGHDYLDGVLCEEPGVDTTPDTRIPGNGVYKYIQIIKVDDDMPPDVAIKDDKVYPITNEDCFTYITLSNTILDMSDYECPLSTFTWEVTLDWNQNGDFDDELVYTHDRFGNFIKGMDLVFEVYDPGSTSYPKALIPFYGPMVSYDVRYVVSDGCGNVGKTFINIMAVDKKPPIPYCVNLSSAVMENGTVELWAKDFDKGSYDYCTDREFLLFTFDEVQPDTDLIDVEHYFDETGAITDPVEISERYAAGEIQRWNPDQLSSAMNFTCDDIPSTTIAMTVWDEKGNSNYCEVTLDLIDNQGACGGDPVADIAGKITTPAGAGINEVDVLLNKEDDGTVFSELSDIDGNYAFESMPMYSKYTITPSKEGDIQNGLSTEDVLLIQKYIMDNSEFSSPYDVIASDLNGDGRISATDLIFLQRIIIGQTTSLKDGIWKFVDASQQLTMENALTEFNSVFTIESLDQHRTSTDFIGIKMGDVNDDVVTNIRNDQSAPRSWNQTVVTMIDRAVVKGEVVEVPVSFRDLDDLVGYQMTIETENASIVEITSGSTSLFAGNIGSISENMMAITYANILAELMDDLVFTLVIEAHQSGLLSDMIYITNGYLDSYAYHTVDVQPSLITLEFIDGEKAAGTFTVSQNNPNPFDRVTQIDFNLPYQGQVNFHVYDLNGKLIYQLSQSYNAGYNNIKLDSEEVIGNNGVYYYRLTFGDRAITRKMIMIK